MSSLLRMDAFPHTSEFWAAVNEAFRGGAETVDLVQGNQIVGTILSRGAAQKAMARKVAEQWIAHPEMLDELAASLEEKAETWD